jgi:hypothetical protein
VLVRAETSGDRLEDRNVDRRTRVGQLSRRGTIALKPPSLFGDSDLLSNVQPVVDLPPSVLERVETTEVGVIERARVFRVGDVVALLVGAIVFEKSVESFGEFGS